MNATQHQIIDAFERQVRAVGYDKANLDDLARELKISKKTIYVHFDGKRDIYTHIVARQALAEKKRLAAKVAKLPTHTARMEAAMRSVLAMGRAHIAETAKDEWLHEYEIAADAFTKATGDLLRELTQDGMDAGEFRGGDAALVEKMIAAMVVEYLLMVNADPAYDRDEELVERIGKFVS
jgi:AcrR family transcriptional regulator